jgi:2-polyprenyl-6-methoxyphenol hydroxylase-like FAD-dependent oxidoreductase
MRVVIVGGGIGGLTTALSLNAAGIACDVYESTRDIRPLGVGINLLPHAVRELSELGLADQLSELAIQTEALIYMNKFGQEIWREARGRFAGYDWPQFSIHRGEFQVLLYEECKRRLGPERVHLGHKLVGVEEHESFVYAAFDTSTANAPELITVECDVLVGADGIHSRVRSVFYPDEGPAKWNGSILWRATTVSAPFLDGHSMVMAGHVNQKFVCYPISRKHDSNGESLINWIAELRVDPRTPWAKEDWNRPGDISDFFTQFMDWNFPGLPIPDIIQGSSAVYEFPMVDRDPVDKWTFGRSTLLGDAAHPMYPIGSNGATQAIVDARCLAFHLATESSIDAALSMYEQERRPPTSALVRANRDNGPERVMQIVENRAPNGFTNLGEIISDEELNDVAATYKRIAGFLLEELRARPSYSVPINEPEDSHH